jgi:hypothetical protein
MKLFVLSLKVKNTFLNIQSTYTPVSNKESCQKLHILVRISAAILYNPKLLELFLPIGKKIVTNKHKLLKP